MALVRRQADLHGVSPASIATRSVLERLVLGDTEVAVLHGWRAKIAGDTLQKMLAGTLRVRLQNGRLHMEETSPLED
jgi:ribonuclease D